MKVAVYHNLPPGGARRVLHEMLRRTHADVDYDLFEVDLGRFDVFAYAKERAERHDISAWARRTVRYPVVPDKVGRSLPRQAWTLSAPQWMDRAQRQIARRINGGGYDVVLVHPCHVTYSPSLLRHLDVPSLYYMHEPRRRSFEAGYQPLDRHAPPALRAVARLLETELRRQDRAAVSAAHRIAANSYYTAESIRRFYGRDAVVCYPGIEPEIFDTGPSSEADPGSSGLFIMSVGALEAVKGHDLVVRALAHLPPASRPVLDLVYERCDPVYQAEVEALASRLGVALELHCGVSDAQLAELYRRAAATVVAARLEPLGLVPLESLACGTPVVAVKEAGYRETVDDGVNGLLVDRSSVDLAAALGRVLAGALGRSREDLRATVMPKWGWDAAAKRQLELLELTAHEASR